MNIYRLSDAWTAVNSLLVMVNKGAFCEAPSTVKGADGWFYLFTSRASGWLPSAPHPRPVGNAATFGAQSGGVVTLAVPTAGVDPQQQQAQPPLAMFADRWSGLCSPSKPATILGFHFFRAVAYTDAATVTATAESLFGIQAGRILSIGKPITASGPSPSLHFVNDGMSSDPGAVYAPKSVPFWVQIYLEAPASLAQIDVAFKMVHGLETYVQYTVLASNSSAGPFDLVADMSTAVDVGFSAAWLNATSPASRTAYQYVRVNVSKVVNEVNNHEADWATDCEFDFAKFYCTSQPDHVLSKKNQCLVPFNRSSHVQTPKQQEHLGSRE
ncbi:hypothetical protein DFJ73DRAFT_921967 [Zopfochytrium polystomum]|nr:hypothetical protein DFJ73DRAFT_921967 [Zopfochytrium polystomum]